MVENDITSHPASWVSLESHCTTVTNEHSDDPSVPVAVDGAAFRALLKSTGVRTVFGPIPLKHALDWPIFASYNELAGCARWMGGRIPTADEVRSAYAHADRLRRNEPANGADNLAHTVPAVNGQLLHNGVEVTPPLDLFAHMTANVGFARWHPVAVTGAGSRLARRCELGGVWEWTSTVLERHDGFRPMSLYPGYTGEFSLWCLFLGDESLISQC